MEHTRPQRLISVLDRVCNPVPLWTDMTLLLKELKEEGDLEVLLQAKLRERVGLCRHRSDEEHELWKTINTLICYERQLHTDFQSLPRMLERQLIIAWLETMALREQSAHDRSWALAFLSRLLPPPGSAVGYYECQQMARYANLILYDMSETPNTWRKCGNLFHEAVDFLATRTTSGQSFLDMQKLDVFARTPVLVHFARVCCAAYSGGQVQVDHLDRLTNLDQHFPTSVRHCQIQVRRARSTSKAASLEDDIGRGDQVNLDEQPAGQSPTRQQPPGAVLNSSDSETKTKVMLERLLLKTELFEIVLENLDIPSILNAEVTSRALFHSVRASARTQERVTGLPLPKLAADARLRFRNEKISEFVERQRQPLRPELREVMKSCIHGFGGEAFIDHRDAAYKSGYNSAELDRVIRNTDCNKPCIIDEGSLSYCMLNPGPLTRVLCAILNEAHRCMSEHNIPMIPDDFKITCDARVVEPVQWRPFELRVFCDPAPKDTLDATFRWALMTLFHNTGDREMWMGYGKYHSFDFVKGVVACKADIVKAFRYGIRRAWSLEQRCWMLDQIREEYFTVCRDGCGDIKPPRKPAKSNMSVTE